MSGKNVSVLALPPGIFSDATAYASGKHWFDGNLIRWIGETMVPVNGWRTIATFGAAPVLNAQVPPAASLANVTGPTPYTFAAQPLGASTTKRVIVGLFIRHTTVPTTAPLVTVAGVNCTRLDTGSLGATFLNIYISDAVVVPATGNIVVTPQTGVATTACKVYQYEYVGPDPLVNGPKGSSGAVLTVTTTTPLVVPPRSKGLAIAEAFIANDPILWTWPGSTVDNSEANAEQSTSMAKLLSVGLNTSSEFITQSGLLSAQRAIFSTMLGEVIGQYPIRDMFTWRDNLKNPWLAAGASDKLWGLSYNPDSTFTGYDITPATLAFNPGGLVGFGRGAYGSGPYSVDAGGSTIDPAALWSMDNFGRLLIAVQSQDGRLFSWDPLTPATVAAPVLNAPVDNELCITTNEEFCMVLGGTNNPRRVKWASQRSLTDWTPTEINSAGGFDLQSNGSIVACQKVPQGVLVVTTADIHLLQYIGPPNYYGRRRISDEGSIVGKNCLVPVPGGAIWMGNSDFWIYLGGTVNRLPCTVHTDAFYNSELSQPENVFMGINEIAGEVWAFFPARGGNTPTNYVSFAYANGAYWSKGALPRTAWCNPVWQPRPLAAAEQTLYEHEFGATADGASRNGTIFAETGALEIGEGDDVMRADRIYQDAGVQPSGRFAISDPLAYTATFKLRQAPNAPERIYGPVELGDPKGYTTVRFRARQMAMRIDQTKDEIWILGKLRLRLKTGGKR